MSSLVIGHGLSAMASIIHLLRRGETVEWRLQDAVETLPILPSVGDLAALDRLRELAQDLGIHVDEPSALRIRFFRQKAFQPAPWQLTARSDHRQETLEEVLWVPERAALSGDEVTTSRSSLIAVIEQLQNALVKCAGVTVTSGRGMDQSYSNIVYAGRPGRVREFESGAQMPKRLVGYGLLQVRLTHRQACDPSLVDTAFMLPMPRDAGDTHDRNVWGYFWENQSVWSVFLSTEESSDNPVVSKKLRKLRQSVTKAMSPPGEDFFAGVIDERVAFEETSVFAGRPVQISSADERIRYLSDAWGPAWALSQAELQFGAVASQS